MELASASSAASEEAAETAQTTGMRAISAFCVISKLARPLTRRVSGSVPDHGSQPCSTPKPMALSQVYHSFIQPRKSKGSYNKARPQPPQNTI